MNEIGTNGENTEKLQKILSRYVSNTKSDDIKLMREVY